eukprot:9123952-Pyramimonas_sp.AAC.1
MRFGLRLLTQRTACEMWCVGWMGRNKSEGQNAFRPCVSSPKGQPVRCGVSAVWLPTTDCL